MIKVLFVDDEPKVLEGLQRALRMQRDDWEMVFASGGAAGIAELNASPFDVVITDMRMPQVDGAALLRHAAEKSPQTVRIALSGQTDMGAMLRTVRYAHLFLTKPCEMSTIVGAVDRVRQLHALLSDTPLRALVGSVASLPTAPRVYTALERAVLSPDAGTDAVARIVAQDMALSAKIMQLVNSAFFGLPRSSTRIEHAVSYLGITVLRALVLAHEIAEVFGNRPVAGFSLEAHETHALLVANIARRIMRDRTRADEAFIAAILHDVGKVMLVSRLPERFSEAAALATQNGTPLHVAEQELTGVTHAEIGAYLLGLWGLPFSIVEAVANHHTPGRVVAVTADDVLVAVHVANALAHELREGVVGAEDRLDWEFLERIGADAFMPTWRQIAAEQYAMFQQEDAATTAAPSPVGQAAKRSL
jgi:putative nucleotidyltransferase with HDIG domain